VLPRHLIAQYWAEVQELLQQQHNLSEQQAREGIADYRERMEMHQAEDVIYNQHTYELAEIIAAAVRHGGFREPEPVAPAPVVSAQPKKARQPPAPRKRKSVKRSH
jgi:hypothetical protein